MCNLRGWRGPINDTVVGDGPNHEPVNAEDRESERPPTALHSCNHIPLYFTGSFHTLQSHGSQAFLELGPISYIWKLDRDFLEWKHSAWQECASVAGGGRKRPAIRAQRHCLWETMHRLTGTARAHVTPSSHCSFYVSHFSFNYFITYFRTAFCI